MTKLFRDKFKQQQQQLQQIRQQVKLFQQAIKK